VLDPRNLVTRVRSESMSSFFFRYKVSCLTCQHSVLYHLLSDSFNKWFLWLENHTFSRCFSQWFLWLEKDMFQFVRVSGFCGYTTIHFFFGRLGQFWLSLQPVVVWFWNWTIYGCFNLWFLWFRQHKSAACSVGPFFVFLKPHGSCQF